MTQEPREGNAEQQQPQERRDADDGQRERREPDAVGLLAPSEGERAERARARGLDAPYIAGGRDPEPDSGLREERFYGRLLLIMAATIIAGGFILGIIANVIQILQGR